MSESDSQELEEQADDNDVSLVESDLVKLDASELGQIKEKLTSGEKNQSNDELISHVAETLCTV